MHAHQQDESRLHLTAGTCLGKYQVVRLLGTGGMGSVYEGIHLEIGKKVAIKMMSPALAEIPDARSRFLREAQLTSRVRHPHAVDVTDVGSVGELAFLVMEYLEGEDLAHHLVRHGPMALADVVDILLPAMAAVATAHDEGIIHRDLKPHNIFLAQTREGAICPKVLDFGISKGPSDLQPTAMVMTQGSPVQTVGLMGSPNYLSPEQVRGGGPASAASDQYSLGIILYECVTGRSLFAEDDLAAIFAGILQSSYEPIGHYRPDLPEEFQQVVAKAMSLEPADRFVSVRAMGRALLPFASDRTRLLWQESFGDGPPAIPTVGNLPAAAADGFAATSPSIRIPRRSPVGWLLGLLVLVAGGVGGAIAVHRYGSTASVSETRPVAAPAWQPPPATAAPPAPEPTQTAAAIQPPASVAEERPRAASPSKRRKFGPNKAPLIE
jgi:eukaryotic-like serine/threonine-protein kinase